VRTARGATALLRLADGSRLELRERTELAVDRGWRGATVELARGNVIVEAAPQGRGRLAVETGDCRATVHGTIFAVNSGVSGSRVSVVEGEVRVAASGGAARMLGPGDQAVSRAGLGRVPVAEEVAWSRDAGRYRDLLAELDALHRAIGERVSWPGLRTEARLLEAVPAGAFADLAAPNLSTALAEGWVVFQERLAESPVLAEWWAEFTAGGDAEAHFDEVVGRLRDFGGYLGEEVVIVALDANEGPLVLAEAVRPGFAAYLAEEAARINAEHGETAVTVVADPAAGCGEAGCAGLLVWTDGSRFVASSRLALVAAAVATIRGEAPSFAGSDLAARVAAAYADGVEWLLAADFESLLAGLAVPEGEREHFEAAGLADLQAVVIEHRSRGERALTTAELGFAGPRHGVAGWLAAPGPLGALDFVSPEAAVAAAFAVDDPVAAVGDLARLAGEGVEGGERWLADLQATAGLDLADDLAATLGGEVAFALDGPLAPQPSWKVIVEVYDPDRLQATIASAVERLDAESRAEGGPGVALTPEEVAGRPAWQIAAATGQEAHYLFAEGYLIAAPTAALLERTLAQRAAGSTLPASAAFRALLPADRHTGLSAVGYQHLAPVLAPVAGELERLAQRQAPGDPDGAAAPGPAAALRALATDRGPSLVAVYAEADRIVAAADGPGGFLGLPGLPALSGLGGLGALTAAGAEAQR
jgi:hypothetical protein